MRETLKMMRELIVGYEKDKEFEELLREYRELQSPNILAYLFVKNYGLISTFSREYPLLDTQDIASYSLQELDKALTQFVPEKDCGFNTFYGACLKNRFRSEQGLLQTDLRYANYCTEDFENHLELEDVNFDFELFDLNNYSLTSKEKEQCKLYLEGYTTMEIAKLLNITKQGAYFRKQQIGKKLASVL